MNVVAFEDLPQDLPNVRKGVGSIVNAVDNLYATWDSGSVAL